LSVNVTSLEAASWPRTISADGSIAAWQEAIIGAETSGLRLQQVLVNVGDTVRRGQVLAEFRQDTVRAEAAATRAAVAEAQAALAEAQANAERARQLQPQGFMSAQQVQQALTVEQTARARVEAQKARLAVDDLRLSQTRVLAPDDGVISARPATVGSVVQPGQELFRLIRQGRLEWRGEVPQVDLERVQPGQPVSLTLTGGTTLNGKVRTVAPTLNPGNRLGLVYVDVPAGGVARAGMFATGRIELGTTPAQTLPQSAVLLREGFHLVYTVGPGNRLRAVKIDVGRRVGDRIEVRGGLKPEDRVVVSGGAFLSEGDLVKVVASAPAAR
jgi:RND family efflux transporter MFP subunit